MWLASRDHDGRGNEVRLSFVWRLAEGVDCSVTEHYTAEVDVRGLARGATDAKFAARYHTGGAGGGS